MLDNLLSLIYLFTLQLLRLSKSKNIAAQLDAQLDAQLAAHITQFMPPSQTYLFGYEKSVSVFFLKLFSTRRKSFNFFSPFKPTPKRYAIHLKGPSSVHSIVVVNIL